MSPKKQRALAERQQKINLGEENFSFTTGASGEIRVEIRRDRFETPQPRVQRIDLEEPMAGPLNALTEMALHAAPKPPRDITDLVDVTITVPNQKTQHFVLEGSLFNRIADTIDAMRVASGDSGASGGPVRLY